MIESVNEDFNIVIEATAGRSVISDIAIDDIALMNNEDCTEAGLELQSTTENVPEESGGIFDVMTCANRCNETQSIRFGLSTISKSTSTDSNGGIIEKCDCHMECIDLGSCCFDYRVACLNDDGVYTFE